MNYNVFPFANMSCIYVPLLYLQNASFPPVSLTNIYTMAANFRIDSSDLTKINRDIDVMPHTYFRCKYSIEMLLTIKNSISSDGIIFNMPADSPVSDEEMNMNDVLRVLLGEQTISFMDRFAAFLQHLRIVRHFPHETELYGLQPRIITIREHVKED